MGFLLGEYVAGMEGRDNLVYTCFTWQSPRNWGIEKKEEASKDRGKCGAYFWSAFVCILFDLSSSVSYGVAITYLFENYMTCFG